MPSYTNIIMWCFISSLYAVDSTRPFVVHEIPRGSIGRVFITIVPPEGDGGRGNDETSAIKTDGCYMRSENLRIRRNNECE